MTTARIRPRPRMVALVAVVALVGLVGQRFAVKYLSRDRWDQDPSLLRGTQFQFTTAEFYVFNETGHEAIIRVSAGNRLLFEQRLPAERVPVPDAGDVHRIHEYTGRYPYAHVYVQNFDTLTRWLELTELPGGRTQTVDLESLPKTEAGDFSIRLTARGCRVRRATYGFI